MFVNTDIISGGNYERDREYYCREGCGLLFKSGSAGFVTLTVNGNNCLISKRVIFIGTLNKSIVHPREVFAAAISDHAAGIVLVHNHPSGNPEPSNEDIIMPMRIENIRSRKAATEQKATKAA